MEPPLAAVGSAPVAVLSQSSGIAAILCHEGVVTWCTIIAPFTYCCTNSAVASIAVVTELSSKREVCVLGTPSSFRISFRNDGCQIDLKQKCSTTKSIAKTRGRIGFINDIRLPNRFETEMFHQKIDCEKSLLAVNSAERPGKRATFTALSWPIIVAYGVPYYKGLPGAFERFRR